LRVGGLLGARDEWGERRWWGAEDAGATGTREEPVPSRPPTLRCSPHSSLAPTGPRLSRVANNPYDDLTRPVGQPRKHRQIIASLTGMQELVLYMLAALAA